MNFLLNLQNISVSYIKSILTFIFLPFFKFLVGKGVKNTSVIFFRGLLFICLVVYPLFFKLNFTLSTVGFLISYWFLGIFTEILIEKNNHPKTHLQLNSILSQGIYGFYTLGVSYIGLASPFLFFYHLMITVLLRMVVSLAFSPEGDLCSDQSRFNPVIFNFLSIIPFLLLFFNFGNYLNLIIGPINTVMTVIFGYYFVQLIRKYSKQ